MLLWAFQPYKLTIPNNTVESGAKNYLQILYHTPTLYVEISEIFNIFYFS